MSKAFVKFSSYEGHALIEIWKESKGKEYRQFSFGKGKAEAILDCIDEIKKFVEDSDKTKAETLSEMRKNMEKENSKDFKQAQANDTSFASDDIPF